MRIILNKNKNQVNQTKLELSIRTMTAGSFYIEATKADDVENITVMQNKPQSTLIILQMIFTTKFDFNNI